MGEVIDLKSRAEKGDTAAKTWTPIDALKACMADIETLKPTCLYIAMIIPGDDKTTHRLAYVQSGMGTIFETIGILKVHTDYHASQWYDDEITT